jgi:hypothetical protein
MQNGCEDCEDCEVCEVCEVCEDCEDSHPPGNLKISHMSSPAQYPFERSPNLCPLTIITWQLQPIGLFDIDPLRVEFIPQDAQFITFRRPGGP